LARSVKLKHARIAANRRICGSFDVPFWHSLAGCNRSTGRSKVRWRQRVGELWITSPSRSTSQSCAGSLTAWRVHWREIDHATWVRRAERPFGKNAALLPPNSEDVKGAFTGANYPQQGRMEAARNGTPFLDKIGDLPVDLQAKLLPRPAGEGSRAGMRIHFHTRNLRNESRSRRGRAQRAVPAGPYISG
jgi:hypothetical protein